MRESKSITNTAKFIMTIIVWGLFILTWSNDYNAHAFRSHRTEGFIGAIIVWLLVYLWACDVFKAFSIASSSVLDIIISQLICVGLTDAIAFVAVCLLGRGWVNIIPGLLCYVCQLLIAALAVVLTKRQLLVKMTPSRTIVIYGKEYTKESARFFSERLLEKYQHMFEIEEIVESDDANLISKIDANERVVFAGVPYEQRKEYAKYCIDNNMTFYYIPEIEEIIFQNCTTKNLLDTPLNRYDFVESRKSYLIAKRIIDLLLAIQMLIIAIPFIVVAAIAIKIEDRGPIFFKQLRVTKDEKTFNIIKLRSMVIDADEHGVRPTTEGDSRITKVGAFIRKTRIDELPQLINIIKGDMSFVGPRPERIEHVQKYEAELPEFKYRHMVKGGLTGYAQVYGKYNTSPEDKLKLDLLYIMNQNLYLDFRLFLLTIRTVFQKESTEGFK